MKPLDLFNEPFEILHKDFNGHYNKFLDRTLKKLEDENLDEDIKDENIEFLGKALLSYLKLALASGSGYFFVIFTFFNYNLLRLML